VTIDTLRDTYNGKQVDLLPAGTVLVVESRPPNTVEVRHKSGGLYNDGIGATLVRKAVNQFPGNQDPDEIGKIFATSERKKAGDTWPANKDLLWLWANKNRVDKLTPDMVSGTAKVVGIVKEGGVTYVDLELTVTKTFTNFNETMFNGQPCNLKVNGESKEVFTFRFPADYSTGPVKSSWKLTHNLRHEGTLNGQNSTLVTEIRDGWGETAKYSGEGGKAK
jgi:hypothetical protein